MKYAITVKPGSSQEKIIESTSEQINSVDGAYTVYLRAKPHDGEANSALLIILSKHFKVPKTTIRIISGFKSRVKIVEII